MEPIAGERATKQPVKRQHAKGSKKVGVEWEKKREKKVKRNRILKNDATHPQKLYLLVAINLLVSSALQFKQSTFYSLGF